MDKEKRIKQLEALMGREVEILTRRDLLDSPVHREVLKKRIDEYFELTGRHYVWDYRGAD